MRISVPLALIAFLAAGSGPQAARGSITGVVRDADQMPVPGAQVTASLAGRSELFVVIANDKGQFALLNLPVGHVTIEASKPGYIPGQYGQRSPRGPGASVPVSEITRLTGLHVPVWKHAVIAGRVTDADGEPLPAVTVEALRRQRTGQGDVIAASGAAVTDDRGIFRLPTLVPGTYLLAVRPSPARNRAPHFGYPGQLYPNARTTDLAIPLELQSGQELTGIDFRLNAESSWPIRGRITDPDGAGREVDVHLYPRGSDALAAGLWLGRTRSDADGHFSFDAVHPGAYVIRATLNPESEYLQGHAIVKQMNRGEWATLQLGVGSKPLVPASRAPGFHAEAEVTLDGRDAARVTITLEPSARIRGKVVFSGASAPDAEELLRTAVLAQAIDGRVLGPMTAARLEADSSFETAAVPPGEYGLNWIGLGGWALKSVTIAGREVTDSGFEHGSKDLDHVVITLTSSAPEITGVLRDEKGMPVTGGSVLLFPADRLKWSSRVPAVRRFAELRTNMDGSFRDSSLLAGDYFVVAPRRDVPDYWQTLAILERLTLSATRVSLVEGRRSAQDLTVSDVRVR